jgi:HlyD family secretion protein
LEQAANALRDRQAEYDRIYWDNRKLEGELARFGQELPRERVDQEAAALRAVESAEQDMAQAQVAYEQARQAEISGIQAAEAQLRDAQAGYDRLMAPADRDKLAAARAQVAQAEANLARLLGETRAGGLQAAEAEIANAQANLDRLTVGPREVDLAVALAQIQQAETTLKQAGLALEQATLTAPFAGTVAELNLKLGEVPDMTRAAIVLADLAEWQLETTDLTELSVAAVRVGAPAKLTFDALPGVELSGTVARIKPLGENKQGDITYTVVIVPDRQDERLRWNMTSAVAISPP